jgi:hypothetical protein
VVLRTSLSREHAWGCGGYPAISYVGSPSNLLHSGVRMSATLLGFGPREILRESTELDHAQPLAQASALLSRVGPHVKTMKIQDAFEDHSA